MSDCPATFGTTVDVHGGELRIYRCDWGWYVRGAVAEARSRYLDEAFAAVVGPTLDAEALRALVAILEQELTAERDRGGTTASRTISLD